MQAKYFRGLSAWSELNGLAVGVNVVGVRDPVRVCVCVCVLYVCVYVYMCVCVCVVCVL